MSAQKTHPPHDIAPRQAFRDWISGMPGKLILEYEKVHFNRVLGNLFGYHIVQLGCMDDEGVLQNSRISHKCITRLNVDGIANCHASCAHTAEALPLASDSIDVLVLPHVLEYTKNPHQLLREVSRVLIGEGHVVISGFNPFSLLGLWRLLLAWRGRAPWHGHFYRLFRIRDWLTLLDFDVLSCHYCFYRPPLRSEKVMERISFIEHLGRHCWPVFSGVFIIVAKKRVIPLTPVKHKWLSRRKTISLGVAEPTARSDSGV